MKRGNDRDGVWYGKNKSTREAAREEPRAQAEQEVSEAELETER